MIDDEFSRLLQAYIFGTVSATDQARLAAAALESQERGLEFGQAEELRERLVNQAFRRELIRTLPAPPTTTSWWRALLVPRYMSGLAAGVALAVVILFIRVSRSDRDTSQMARVDPARGMATPGGRLAAPANQLPLAIESQGIALLNQLFALPSDRTADLGVTLPGGNLYRPVDSVSVMFTLPEAARVYAIVRGPSGSMRKVYPVSADDDRLRPAGSHGFSFPASGRMDPEAGGRSQLRIFTSSEDVTLSSESELWRRLIANARFGVGSYEVHRP
jgi:hypothetical protein